LKLLLNDESQLSINLAIKPKMYKNWQYIQMVFNLTSLMPYIIFKGLKSLLILDN
jgi:hypothetical protein